MKHILVPLCYGEHYYKQCSYCSPGHSASVLLAFAPEGHWWFRIMNHNHIQMNWRRDCSMPKLQGVEGQRKTPPSGVPDSTLDTPWILKAHFWLVCSTQTAAEWNTRLIISNTNNDLKRAEWLLPAEICNVVLNPFLVKYRLVSYLWCLSLIQ